MAPVERRRRGSDDDVPTDAEMRLRARAGLALFLVAALAGGVTLILDGCLV